VARISSIEVEDALYRHPKFLEAAVVATSVKETPCALLLRVRVLS
jgi:acyl-coenzyme A synthetase/AMP-(fatty) acid ligase